MRLEGASDVPDSKFTVGERAKKKEPISAPFQLDY